MYFKVTKITLPHLAPQKPFAHQVYAHPRKTLIVSASTIAQLKLVLREVSSSQHLAYNSQIKSIIFVGFS
jgi:hypothetical protein